MLWKNDKIISFQSWSISKKLTFLYTIVSGTLLTLIAILLCWALSEMMVTAEKQYLVDEARIIQNLLQKNPTNYTAITQEVNGVPTSIKNASYYYYVNLFNQKGQTIMESPDFQRSVKSAQFPSINKNNWWASFFNWKSASGKPYC